MAYCDELFARSFLYYFGMSLPFPTLEINTKNVILLSL